VENYENLGGRWGTMNLAHLNGKSWGARRSQTGKILHRGMDFLRNHTMAECSLKKINNNKTPDSDSFTKFYWFF